jgi:lysophospholipase L1-like esterase
MMRKGAAKTVFKITVSVFSLCLLFGHAYADDKRILVFGDSNAWGWQAVAGGAPVTRLSDSRRWAGVLQTGLGADYKVVVDGLSGRTVSSSYPENVATLSGAEFSGENTLRIALAREAPLDLVLIMLGTNDVQAQLGRQTDEIAEGIGKLVAIVRKDYAGVFTKYGAPKVLVIVPPPIGDVSKTPFKDAFAGEAKTKSEQLSAAIFRVAQRDGFPAFDGGQTIKIRSVDGLHLSAKDHSHFGKSLVPVVRRLIGALPDQEKRK